MLVLLSNYSKMMRACKKSSKMIIKNVLLQIFSNSTSVMFWGSAGPKNVRKRASCDGRINAEKYVEILQDNFFQETEAMFGKKVSHSSSNMSVQPLTNQYLPKFT